MMAASYRCLWVAWIKSIARLTSTPFSCLASFKPSAHPAAVDVYPLGFQMVQLVGPEPVSLPILVLAVYPGVEPDLLQGAARGQGDTRR